jgi:hypothetical protein
MEQGGSPPSGKILGGGEVPLSGKIIEGEVGRRPRPPAAKTHGVVRTAGTRAVRRREKTGLVKYLTLDETMDRWYRKEETKKSSCDN